MRLGSPQNIKWSFVCNLALFEWKHIHRFWWNPVTTPQWALSFALTDPQPVSCLRFIIKLRREVTCSIIRASHHTVSSLCHVIFYFPAFSTDENIFIVNIKVFCHDPPAQALVSLKLLGQPRANSASPSNSQHQALPGISFDLVVAMKAYQHPIQAETNIVDAHTPFFHYINIFVNLFNKAS